MKYKPFTSKHCTPSRFTSPLKLSGSGSSTNDAVEKQRVKDASKFLGKQAIKQGLKSAGKKALAGAFGVAGSLLNPTKLYAQGKSSADVATEQYLKNNPDAKLVRSIEDLQ